MLPSLLEVLLASVPRAARIGAIRVVATPLVLVLALASPGAGAEEVRVAVAANFTAPAKLIAEGFERATGHHVAISSGATGKFFAQIESGAPFDVLLSADQQTPKRLEAESFAVPGTRFTYAIGQLVLWSSQAGVVDPQGAVLRSDAFTHVAICDPKLAPYGEAAVETMKALGVYEKLQPKFVQGESITQAYQFVASGNAEIGFVALSQVFADGKIREGSGWRVPSDLHAPLRQDAVLLLPGRDNPAARAWLAWLKGDTAKAAIRSFGYEVPPAVASK